MSETTWHDRAEALRYTIRNFINGEYHECAGPTLITKHSPRDGQVLYSFGTGTRTETDIAVEAAKRAFDAGDWSRLPVAERKRALLKLATLIETHREELALLETMDVGKPISISLGGDIPTAVETIRTSAESVDKLFSPSHADGPAPNLVFQLRKPIGVVGAIVGWNFPLGLACTKIGPALAMGNSVVLKPSELTPLSASRLAELAHLAGIPKGVFNVVNGTGSVVGASLAEHNDVGLLSFTGSTATGKVLLSSSAKSNMKRLMLECGGKSPFLVFDEPSLDTDFVASLIVSGAFENQGQVCSAGTRLVVEESIKEELLSKVVELSRAICAADPLDPSSTYGPMLGEQQACKILGFVERAVEAGSTVIAGGSRVREESGGWYLEPTVIDGVAPESELAQEEVFGPVLAVSTFADEQEAVSIANNSDYGLAAYVATERTGRALRMSQRLNAGYILIVSSPTMSPGGVLPGLEPLRQSGFGFEHGLLALNSYSVTSTTLAFG